jgi:iron complex transport system ATP-binding protein
MSENASGPRDDIDISVKGATVVLDGKRIIENLDWQVGKGERWFILGPNGAGKTTLVKMLLGILWPLYGAEIKVLGRRYGACDLSEVRKHIAWISPFLKDWTEARWTVLDVALSGLDSTIGFYRVPRKAEVEKAMHALEIMGCAHLAERHFDRISSGEQVKALVSRALICRPELMILDEACVYLDLGSREILLAAVDKLARRKDSPTILFITQRIEEITKSFERGMILGGGQIVKQGSRDEILTEENIRQAFKLNVSLTPSADGRLWPVIR